MKPGPASGFFYMESYMDPVILNEKEPFRRAVIENLGRTPIDFTDKWDFIQSGQYTAERYSAAGVLLLLHFREGTASSASAPGEYCFHLIKRSAQVSQPGDLSCPGGMLAPRLDAFLKPLIALGLIPVLGGAAKQYARQRQADTFNTLMLFLTNAVRESWEEIRLSPFNIQFLGPLPCHTLILFKRTIFPLVGLVKNAPSYRLNHEVERIVEIPVKAFFQKENYARYQVEAVDSIRRGDQTSWEFPCFVQREEETGQEILWGATLYIIIRFLEILFDFKLPDIRSNPVISRTLQHSYITGAK
jgi:8-oxo-dGTP pyrophosphatase MutT (NUDIX family)